MLLEHSRPLGWIFAVLIFSFAVLSVVQTPAQTGGDAPAATGKSNPLYLHWFKPWYAGNETPPEHILTFRVTPSEDFVVVFSDPKLKGREFKIDGRIDERDGSYFADFRARWLSVEDFRCELKPDQARNGTMVAFSGAYFSTRVAISHDRSANAILTREATAARMKEPVEAESKKRADSE